MTSTSNPIDESVFNHLVPLNVLSPSHRANLAEHSSIVSLSANETFSSQYDGSDFTYYVLEGELGIYEGERLVDTVVGGNEAAAFALNQIRSQQIHAKARTDVNLLRVEISLISTLLIWMQSAAAEGNQNFSVEDSTGWLPKVLSSELFARISPANIVKIFRHLEPLPVKTDQAVITQGEPGDYYYIIRKGECAVTRVIDPASQPVLLASLSAGDSFGEEALIANAKRNATVTMASDGELLRLTKEDFRSLISDPLIKEVDAIEASALIAGGCIWLDVRNVAEYEDNGLPGSVHVALAKLRDRAGSLESDKTYVVYSDSGIRSTAAAFILTELGYSAIVLRGGLHANRVLLERDGVKSADVPDVPNWVKELEQANQEVEGALQNKLEATTARQLWSSEFEVISKQTDVRIEAKKRKLELESATASKALANALRKKLEVESRLRSSEADAARKRAEAEAECDSLRKQAEAMLSDEQQRLQLQYSQAAARLDELKQAREKTEERLRREQERIEEEFHKSQRTLQFEAKKIKEELERVKNEVEEKAQRIRSEEATKEQQVRRDTENSLRRERMNLERQFANSVSDLEKAQRKLAAAEAAKTEADEEAKRTVETMRVEAEKRRAAAEAQRAAEQAKLAERVHQADESLDHAEQQRSELEAQRRAAMQKLARLRAASGDVDDTPDTEQELKKEIERFDEGMTSAIGRVDAAQRAKDDADAVRLAAEEKAARQRATEEELRLKIYEEAEVWLEEEQARSQAELDQAKKELAEKWAMREEAELKRRDGDAASDTLFEDISAQLQRPDASLQSAIGDKAYAEERSHLTEEARQMLSEDKAATEEALEAARSHMNQLRRQGLLD